MLGVSLTETTMEFSELCCIANVDGRQCGNVRTNGKYCLDHCIKSRAQYNMYKKYELKHAADWVQLPADLSNLSYDELLILMEKCTNECRVAKKCYEMRRQYRDQYVHPNCRDKNHEMVLDFAQACYNQAESNLKRLYNYMINDVKGAPAFFSNPYKCKIIVPRKNHTDAFDAISSNPYEYLSSDPQKLQYAYQLPGINDSVQIIPYKNCNSGNNDCKTIQKRRAEPKPQANAIQRARRPNKEDLQILNCQYKLNARLNTMRDQLESIIDKVAEKAVERFNYLYTTYLKDNLRFGYSKREFKEVRVKAEHTVVRLISNFLKSESTDCLVDLRSLQTLMRLANVHDQCRNELNRRLCQINNLRPELHNKFIYSFAEGVSVQILREFSESRYISNHKRKILTRLCDLMFKHVCLMAEKLNKELGGTTHAPLSARG